MRLTTPQRQMIDAVTAPWLAAALRTDPIDAAEAHARIAAGHMQAGLAVPEIILCSSPWDALKKIKTYAPVTTDNTSLSAIELQHLLSDGVSSHDLMPFISRAQPQGWPRLGEEFDSSFHYEISRGSESSQEHGALEEMNKRLEQGEALDWMLRPDRLPVMPSSAMAPLMVALGNRVDNALSSILQLSHAVGNTLETLVTESQFNWLLYSKGSVSLWQAAETYARFESMQALGLAGATPAELAVGRAILNSCGWLYSFERICFVCERPQHIIHPSLDKQSGGDQIRLAWRDDFSCEMDLDS
ncbi:MAG: hypothetical protein V4812_08300 [Pseudomonadota bacterium]